MGKRRGQRGKQRRENNSRDVSTSPKLKLEDLFTLGGLL